MDDNGVDSAGGQDAHLAKGHLRGCTDSVSGGAPLQVRRWKKKAADGYAVAAQAASGQLRSGDERTSEPPLLSPAWSHYLVLDFEGTCERDDPTQKSWTEIIEFPCVLLDAETLQKVNEFHEFVRPTERPLLSAFCTELTSITQDQVDAASPIGEVCKRFSIWLAEAVGSSDLSRVLPITCGEPDLQWMLPGDLARKGLPLPRVFQRYCNIKRPFATFLGRKAGGMMSMLRDLNIKHIGKHHLGIDDTRNIANIVIRLATRGAQLTATGETSPGVVPRGRRR
eukprot:TRINITY_DN80353_c0_g1_i1.p1 TRINITY_DN80353_c0_g1~~TRINITY_DN80353_c0_g1_i1.p1  ORF type:complete len:282 (-),score=29.62 TRINITY_DN80353_c0_g1_i1:376-1221(-)